MDKIISLLKEIATMSLHFKDVREVAPPQLYPIDSRLMPIFCKFLTNCNKVEQIFQTNAFIAKMYF